MPTYEILRLIWWALLGVLLIGIGVRSVNGYETCSSAPAFCGR